VAARRWRCAPPNGMGPGTWAGRPAAGMGLGAEPRRRRRATESAPRERGRGRDADERGVGRFGERGARMGFGAAAARGGGWKAGFALDGVCIAGLGAAVHDGRNAGARAGGLRPRFHACLGIRDRERLQHRFTAVEARTVVQVATPRPA